ncbi:NADH dehydrogenase subunit 2 [Tanacetum coccineum]
MAGTISMCFDSSEQERFDAFESIVLIPLPTRSMLFIISAYDSIAMYLAIEPQSLCFYVIAASKRKSKFSTEAGLKYLILVLGLCLDLPCAKSKGLVPMEIPLSLIPRLMTKGELAWRKVKIGGVEKIPFWGIPKVSEGIQCPTTDSSWNCVIEAEPGMTVIGHPPSPVREALFNTLRKDVHRGQKDSVIGT